MPPHAVAYRVGAGEHEPNFVDGYIQLPQQPDPAEHQHVLFSIIPVAVFRVSPGTDQPLLLVEADVLFLDSRQDLDLVDFHTGHRLSAYNINLPAGGKSSVFLYFWKKLFCARGTDGELRFRATPFVGRGLDPADPVGFMNGVLNGTFFGISMGKCQKTLFGSIWPNQVCFVT